MATSDIEKLAVFDARIVQMPPAYSVEKGAMSLTNAPFRAITASTSQHTYQINVPSQNVFVDRAIDWSSDVFLQMAVDLSGSSLVGQAYAPVLNFGKNAALCAFPLHELTQTMTASINDTSVVINTDTVLKEVLRLTDYKKNRLVRHCPTMLDRYASYSQSAGAINSPLEGYFSATASDEVPNGAWGQVTFYDEAGTALPISATPSTYASGAATYRYGVPCLDASGTVSTNFPIYLKFRSSEKLVLSPFIFADAHEWETGLFGINNMNLVCNLKTDPKRVIRISSNLAQGGITWAATPTYWNVTNGAFQNAQMNVQFLTPSLDLPLPEKSSVSYFEFPRYITTGTQMTAATGAAAAAGSLPGYPSPTPATVDIQSQTIVLPNIPDFLIIYVKPDVVDADQGDYYFPIQKISMNFDNFAGLLSNHSPEQLYQLSTHNGLEMDWNEWNGIARVATTDPSGNPGGLIQTVGGFLVIKPGTDFGLQAGQAPSLIGNFTLQFTVTVKNYSAYGGAQKTASLYVIAANSGFFESLAGSSRIIKGVLSEADIISAEPIMEMTRDRLNRIVGGSFLGKLGSMLGRAIEIYSKVKPVASAVKGVLPEGRVKDVMGKMGFGMAGAAMPAGAGGAMRKGKKSLSERLM
jgi:hypothetical protein